MADLRIYRVLESRFEFSLDGGERISDNAPNLTTFGDIAHFKTRNGANLIKEQKINYSEITVIDSFGGTGTFTFPNIQAVWTKLIELNFFAGVSGGGGSGGGGVTRFDALLDTFTYFGNDGKIPVVDESQLRLVPTEFYNIKDFVDLDDVGFSTLVAGKILSVANVSGVPKIVLIDPPTGGGGGSSDLFSAVGGFYYADEGTKTNPLVYSSGDLQLENDIMGAETFLNHPPYGISRTWDEATNTVDLSQLSIGDELFVRVDLKVTASQSNQELEVKLLLGESTPREKEIFVGKEIVLSSGIVEFNHETNIGLNYQEWRTTNSKLLFSSNFSATIEVIGFHFYVVRKSVNILDVANDNFRSFTLNKKQSPLSDTTVLEENVKIGYDSSNLVNRILFDKDFSRYLRGYASTLKKLELTIFNHTVKNTAIVEILSLTYSNASNEYYVAHLEPIYNQSEFNVGDNLEFQISAYQSNGGGGSAVWGGILGNISNQLDLVALIGNYLPLTGGTLTGPLSAPNFETEKGIEFLSNIELSKLLASGELAVRITDTEVPIYIFNQTGTPTNPKDVITKEFFDANAGGAFIEVISDTPRIPGAKIGTTVRGDYIPSYGDSILITFTEGLSSFSSLTIDGGTSYPARIGTNDLSLTYFNATTTEYKLPLWFNGAEWQMFGSLINTTYISMSVAEMEAGTATTSRVMRADYLNAWIEQKYVPMFFKTQTLKWVLTPLDEDLTTGEIEYKLTIDKLCVCVNWNVDVQVAPQGSSITVRLIHNGAVVGTSNKPILANEFNSFSYVPPSFAEKTFNIGDTLSVFIDSVGAVAAGQCLTMHVEVKPFIF